MKYRVLLQYRRHEDLRRIMMFAIQSGEPEMETFNKAMSMVDELKIKHI